MTKLVLRPWALVLGLGLGPWALGGPWSLVAQRGAATDPAAAERFLTTLQDGVARHDVHAVSQLAQYPMNVLASPFNIPVSDAAAFEKGFDNYLSPELRAALALAGVTRAGAPPPIFPVVLSADAMTIVGRIAARRIGTTFKIARITVPPSYLKGDATVRKPFRVQFPAGIFATRFSGALLRYDIASYIVPVVKGETLQASLYGGGDRDTTLRIIDMKNGVPLDDRAKQGTRVWTGQVPATGDYRVDVVGLTAENGPAAKYMLAINLR